MTMGEFPFGVLGLAAAQLRCVGRAGCAVPVAAGALAAVVGAVLKVSLGAYAATVVMIAIMPCYLLFVAVGAAALLAGDPLVELHGSTPAGVRAVQTTRAVLLALGGMAGALAMFAPLHLLGVVYGDVGWASAITPVGGAAVLVLAAYAAAAGMGSPRAVTFSVVLLWAVLAFFWDTNLMGVLALQRGVPLAAALVAAAGAWFALGSSERACAKAVGAR